MRLLRKICLLGCACSGLCLSTILLTSCSEKTNPFANYKVGQEIHVNSMKEAQSLHDVAITKLPVENTIKSISKSTAGANQLIIEIQGSLPAASDENAKEYGGSIIY
jgi:PBP1b-binding outer membrane lipoprotein LpoB